MLISLSQLSQGIISVFSSSHSCLSFFALSIKFAPSSCDTQHDDIQPNDTQHNNKNDFGRNDTNLDAECCYAVSHSLIVIRIVVFQCRYAECNNADCHYSESRYA